jgi:DNA-directed RNA polymerase sigma subunit (sigma70/sigma32)
VKYRLWILGGIALLLLAVVCEWWIRRRRGKGTKVTDETPPDKLAMRALKDLDALKLFEKGRIKDFYFGFSEILRRYLEAIRGFPAAEYTLEEIAKKLGITRERVRQIERVALKKLKSPKVSKKLREYLEEQ